MKPINTVVAYINVPATNSKIRNIVFMACLCFIYSVQIEQADATTIIVMRTPDNVFIGADSMVHEGNFKVNACKITQVRNIFLAFVGYPIVRQKTEIVFDAISLGEEIFSREETIQDRLTIFETLTIGKLTEVIERICIEDNSLYNRCLNVGDRIALTVIIAIPVAPFPVFYVRAFQIISSNEEPIIIKSVNPIDDIRPVTKGYTEIALPGEHQSILDFIKQHNISSKDIDPIRNIKEWITLEVKAVPDKVGLPIDILSISSNNAVWIQRKPECPEIDQQFFKHSN